MIRVLKIFAGVIIITAAFTLSTILCFAQGDRTGVIAGDNLNVREQPNTTSKILTQLSRNTKVSVVDYSEGWYKISLENITGWVFGEFISVSDPVVLTGSVTADILNVRDNPSTSGNILAKITRNTEVTILSEGDGWYEITVNNVTGWVHGDFIKIKREVIGNGTITGDNVNVRNNPGMTTEVITQMNRGSRVVVLSRYEEWFKIQTDDDIIGWVHRDFITLRETTVSRSGSGDQIPSNSGVARSTQAATTMGGKLVEYGMKFLGVKYVYGGSSPNGFDCSGFVQYVYKNFGIKINRVAADQAKQGKLVKTSELRAGDLVFFDTDGGRNNITHVGMYIGDGQFIHASSGRNTKKVVISSMYGGFYENTYITARRFID